MPQCPDSSPKRLATEMDGRQRAQEPRDMTYVMRRDDEYVGGRVMRMDVEMCKKNMR